jgi:hypothetical protein
MVKGGVVVLDVPSALTDGVIVEVEPLPPAGKKRRLTREQVIKAIDASPLRFTKSWDEIKKETR